LARQGWSHRFAGAALLAWIVFGTYHSFLLQEWYESNANVAATDFAIQDRCRWWLFYDTILGFLGIITTLSAARDFPHKYVRNAQGQSGSLSQRALVTQAEMIEHSFYQGLNLVQAWYLYYVSSLQESRESTASVWQPVVALWVVTSPWLFRHHWSVHSFSHNWKVTPVHKRTNQEVILYQIKKSQYIFYKHVLLHGLNISFALSAAAAATTTKTLNPADSSHMPLTITLSWRTYWLALNISYVMEFFLQTLVKRQVMSVKSMFGLQQLLMTVSSMAALRILVQDHVARPAICLVSLLLNFGNRHHDVLNVMVTAGFFYGLKQFLNDSQVLW